MSETVVRTNKIRNHEIFLKVVVYAISITLVYMTMKPLWDLFMQFLGQGVIRQDEIVNIKLSKILPQRWKEFVSFFSSRTAKGFLNSVIVTAASTILNVYFSAMTAFAISAYKWKLRKIFSNTVLALMMIPNVVASAGFIQMVYRLHLNNNLAMLFLPAIATPISVVFMRLYLDSVFSMDIVYSARIDGAGEIRIFHQIALPIMKPAIATQAVFAIVASWNEMFLPMVIITEDDRRTLPAMLVLNYAMGGDTTIEDLISIVPLVVSYIILSRHIVEDVQLGSVKM